MAHSTLTSKGQTTIPKEIREHLKLQPGHRIEYVVDQAGQVVLRPATYDIRSLHGILKRAEQAPVTVEEMNRIIRRRHGQKS